MPKQKSPTSGVSRTSKLASLLMEEAEDEEAGQQHRVHLTADPATAMAQAVFGEGSAHSNNRKGSLAALLSPVLQDYDQPLSAAEYFGDQAGMFAPFPGADDSLEGLGGEEEQETVEENLPHRPMPTKQLSPPPVIKKTAYNPKRQTPPTAAFRKPITIQERNAMDKSSPNPLRFPKTENHAEASNGVDTTYKPPPLPEAAAAIASGQMIPRTAQNSNGLRNIGKRPMTDRPSNEAPYKKAKPTLTRIEDSVQSADVQEVAQHYNIRPNLGVDQRQNSPIIGLRSFNNWIKTVLINKYCLSPPEKSLEANKFGPNSNPRAIVNARRLKVLDMGCGKGGDLMKWEKVGTTEYVGIDIAEVSIEQAISRIQQMRTLRFDAKFYVADCYSNPISSVLKSDDLKKPFDTVTMQFCMHYAFKSEDTARMMLDNVSKNLRYGGMFVGTIPDSHLLLDRLNELPADELSFGNDVYKVTFETKEISLYGHRYTFYLQDAVDSVPEYVVYWEEFKKLAAEYGLSLVFYSTFAEVFQDEQENPEFKELMRRMKVIDEDGQSQMDEEMFEAVGLYVCFAFTKTG